MKKLLQSKYGKALEIIEETGRLAMSTIDDGDLEKLQDELRKSGYESYVDESNDWLIVEDVTIEIEYGRNGEKSIFAIDRAVVEELIDELDAAEVYKIAYEEAIGYSFSGTAYAILDVTNGEIFSRWLMQNNYMMDDFGEIVLCSINTPLETLTENDLLSDEELTEFHKYIDENWNEYNGIEDYIIEKYGDDSLEERKSNYVDWLASEFEIDYERIKEQLDEVYNRA
jgi:hypothetical protein